jgi:hypothetical protein
MVWSGLEHFTFVSSLFFFIPTKLEYRCFQLYRLTDPNSKYFIATSVSRLADRKLFCRFKVRKFLILVFRIQVFNFRIKLQTCSLFQKVHYIQGEAGSESGSGLTWTRSATLPKGSTFYYRKWNALCAELSLSINS